MLLFYLLAVYYIGGCIMILDRLENINGYFCGDTLLAKAVEFAVHFDPESEAGKYEIDGEKIFANYLHMPTKLLDDLEFEKHEKYIDIQVLFAGELVMGHCFAENNPMSIGGYNAEKDIEKFSIPAKYSNLKMSAGEFVVFYPHDYHMPDICITEPEDVKKLVIKICAES